MTLCDHEENKEMVQTCLKHINYRLQPKLRTSSICNGKSEELEAKFGFVCLIISSG